MSFWGCITLPLLLITGSVGLKEKGLCLIARDAGNVTLTAELDQSR
jgi:hypothetical protein